MLKAGFLASTVMVLGVVSTTVNAASVSTGVAAWKFVDFTPGSANVPGAGNTVRDATDAAALADAAAVSITRNNAWVTPAAVGSTAGLSWVSALSNGATTGLYGWYTYQLTLTAPPLVAGGQYKLAGKFTSDNLVDSFKVNGVELLTALAGPTVTSFNTVFSIPGSTSIAPLVLTIRVYNESTRATPGNPFGGNYPVGPNPENGTSNPHGLIVDGAVTLVPLPPAAFGGLGLMGACAVVSLVRRARA
jgi:hypothetical protein